MYNINIDVTYNDNKSYRECLRKVINMDVSKLNIPWDEMDDDLDEETIDELLFDNNIMSACMDFIYDKTKDCKYFQELYLIGASKMFSQDPEIGLAVLFSYDFFNYFHLVLVDYLKANIISDNFNILKNRIS